MTDSLPSRDQLQPGQTVTVVQEQENNPGEPLIGDIRRILTTEDTHPGGIEVELESGVVGRVKEINPDEP